MASLPRFLRPSGPSTLLPFYLSTLSPFRVPAERLALAGMAAFWIAVVWLWEPAYVTLTVDDSFYYFQIARNVAEGLGSTFDGVQATNGYHPLWMAVLVPIAALPGDDVPVRAALTLQVLLVVGGTWWLGSRLPRAAGRAFEALVALALLAFHTTKILANGQESALQWFLLCVGIGFLLRAPAPVTAREAVRQGLALGFLGSLVTLARLDAIAFGGFAALLPVLWPRDGVARELRWMTTRTAAAVLGLAASAYALGNTLLFGHPLPVSAVIKAEWAGVEPEAVVAAVVAALGVGAAMCLAGRRRFGTARPPRTSQGATGEQGFGTARPPRTSQGATGEQGFGTARPPRTSQGATGEQGFGTARTPRTSQGATGEQGFRTARPPRTSQGATGETGGVGGEPALRAVAPLVVYVVFLVAAQASGGWRWVLQLWYLPPLLLLGGLSMVALARYRLGRIAVAAAAAAYLAVAIVSWALRLDPSSYSTYLSARDTGHWVRDHLPAESRVAGWDVGIVAWHAGGGVTNLEGLAASWPYKREVLDRREVEGYVRESVSHLVQPFPEGFLVSPPFRYEGVDLAGWRLLHAECALFEAAYPGARPHRRVHVVLAAAGADAETLAHRARRGMPPCAV